MALILRFVLVIVVHLYHGPFLFLDDHGYDLVGAKLASAWHSGSFPDPSSVLFAGSSTYGYFVWVGALYYLFGPSWLLVKLFGALISSLAVLPAASIGETLGGERLKRSAAWLVALYPNAVFWGAAGLKDGPLATLFLTVVALGLKPLALRRLLAQLALCGIAFSLRPGLGAVCLLSLVVPLVQGIRAKGDLFRRLGSHVVALAGGGALAYLAITNGSPFLGFLGFLVRSASSESTAALPPGSGLAGAGGALSAFVRALMGPFPWAFGEGTNTVYRALYPGMVLWIVLLPAAGLGTWEVVHRGSAAARGAVVSALVYWTMYLAVFGNEGFFRQRFLLEVFFLILAAFSFRVRADSAMLWTMVWVVCLGPVILVQAGIVPPWGVAALVGIPLAAYALIRRLRDRSLHAG